MQFTRLRLQGFKSFVDPTDLVIMEGLTGVVGPNGCGKSNLLEALRWVMGENRPTQMRGGGMEDVIFAGTDSRGAKHFAEVTLHIDNKTRVAPAAFNHSDELDVIRRITRDIGSAFKINGKDVRARDVGMMFADAATGSHSPSLVRQGQISELINAKPQARRRVLEDAAGISGLYQRRHEAELKLNSAEANLLRVDDVLEQLATQMRSLERQAKAASRYKEVAEELRAAEALLAFIEWKAAAEKFIATERIVTDTRTKRAEAERNRIACEKLLSETQEKLPSLRDEEAIAAALLQRLNIALTSLSDDEKRARTQIEELERASDILARDKTRESQIASDASDALKQLDWEENHIKDATDGEEDAIKAASETAGLAHERLTQSEAKFDEMRQDLAREEARAHAAERRFHEAVKREQSTGQALANSQTETASTKEAHARSQADLELKRTAMATAQAAIAGFEDSGEKLEALQSTLQEQFDGHRAELANRQGEASAIDAERRGLVAMLDKKSDHNPLVDQMKVATGFEAAIGAALGDELNAPVTESGSGWSNTGATDAPSWPAGVEPIAPHIHAPTSLQKRMAYIGIVNTANLELVKQLAPGQRLVTKLGDLYRWDGFVKLASDGENASALRLQQRNRLNELEADLQTRQGEITTLNQAVETTKVNLAKAKSDFETAQRARRDAERALTEAIRQHHSAENEVERLASRLELLTSALARHEEEEEQAKQELCSATEARVDPAIHDEQKTALELHRVAVEDARSEMLTKRAAVDELRKDRERRQTRIQEIGRERDNWQKRLNNTASHQNELEKRMQENAQAKKFAQALPGELEQKRLLLESDIENAEGRLNRAKEALAAGESARAKADQAHREAEGALADIRERLARFEAELEAIKKDRDDANSHIRETYEKTPEEMGGILLEGDKQLPSFENAQNEINRLVRIREGIGAVNLRAEEDRAEVVQEHDKLVSDKAEITEAIANLRQAIAALNKEGRERLLVAFDEVNTNFKQLFIKLFGGGTASLELVESDDPLNAGLEIMCQPPGKKLATLSLLSGGEQTLTALSLIFAVFLTNPSPICVLDEVDAPLDDANVTRFCDMLSEMTSMTETRFLVITHHALTMSRMDRLFGVTMAEKGVSQLVSVDLTQATELVAEN